MSKTTLKKQLALMTAGQIAELVLDLYAARPEAKEYLDFYVQPDIDKRLERAKSNIKKEINRTSRGRNRARITRVRRIVKDISSLNPGTEHVAEIMVYAIETMCAAGSEQWIKETTQRATARMLAEALQTADSAGMLDIYLPRLREAVEGMKSSWFRSNEFKSLLKDALDDALDSL